MSIFLVSATKQIDAVFMELPDAAHERDASIGFWLDSDYALRRQGDVPRKEEGKEKGGALDGTDLECVMK